MGANPDITHPSTEGRMLECPRCGYGLDAGPSLRGDAEGICTECGLAIRWEELVSTYTDPTWFVESRRRRPRIALRGLWTRARCAFPRAFWTRIPLSLPISARGILAFLVAVAVVAHIIAAIGRLEVERRSWRGRWITNADRIVGILTPLNSYAGRAIVANADRLGPQATGIERASVILWTYAYTCDPIGLLAPPIDPRNGNPLHPSMGPVSRTGPPVDSVATARLQTAVLVPLLAPACLLLLPLSLRRARVRMQHILRATVYSISLLLPLLAAAIITSHSGWGYYIGTQDTLGRMAPHLLTIIAAALALPWMLAVASRYLKLPNAWTVALACTTVATLLSLFASSLQFDRL